ncbi:MAG: response regulator [Nitrospinae bacterium]|nr:response regulator [Nitrospinota bacterium]
MLEKATVIVIDSSKTVRKIVASFLRNEMGCRNVVECDQAEEAWDLLTNRMMVADWVICAWELEGMTGFDLLVKIRENQATAGIPFLMMTTHDDGDSIMRALNAGATDYLLKPFTRQRLSEDISKIVALRYRRRVPRFQAADNNPTLVDFGRGRQFEGQLVDISETDLLVNVPQLRDRPMFICDQANITVRFGAEEFSLIGMLFRLERTPGVEDRGRQYAAFNIKELMPADKTVMDRFLDTLKE